MANVLAYGFVGLDAIFVDRVDDANVQVIRDAIAASVAEHNRQVAGILAELVEFTTNYSARFKQAGGGTLQPLDEWGNPLPVKEGGFYDVAWPIQGGGTAWGDNRISRALMTVEEVNEYTLGALRRDADWMKRHLMASILDNTSWAFPDPDKGSLTIQPMANGDTVTYLRNNGTVSTDDHYLAQSADILDASNPFPSIYTELKEHPSNVNAEVVAYIATDLVTDTKALANFEPVQDPDIALGSGSNLLVGSVDRGFGDELLGKVDKVWIVEWSALPNGYAIATARGSSEPALMAREYNAPELQGFFQEENSPDGNLKEHRFIRYVGFGGFNRVAAVALEVGSASYSIPSGFATPLSV